MPAPFNHASGLAGVYDRTPDKPNWARVLFREGRLGQAAEMMEMQSIIEGRGRRVTGRVMDDGARLEGAEIIIDKLAGEVTLTAGKIYLRGDVRDVPEAILTGVTMTGDVVIGVRLTSAVVTEVEDADLLGLFPGSEAEGEPGAGREAETVAWGWSGDGESGDLYQVYNLIDGVAVDQTPPPIMGGFNQALALYDREAHGSYVVRGCRVAALGKIAGAQHFAIGEGVANIHGFKRTRAYALRHAETEDWSQRTVDAEPHTFADGGGGTAVITLNRGPLDVLVSAIVTKQTVETVTKGTGGGIDALANSGVTEIISVKQGGTTYTETTDYVLNADRIDWSPAGAEPAQGSSYDVTYRYLDGVTPDATTDDTVTLSGGVTGTAVLISYKWKLPRTDLLCLDADGNPVYVKGVPSTSTPRAPAQPVALLALAEIANDWRGKPEVRNTDVRSVPYVELWHYIRKLWDALDLVALERLRSDIDSREPVAKKGVFVDPWEDDTYRDAGEVPQTAAAFDGALQLAVTPTLHTVGPASPVLLDYTDDIVLRQPLVTSSMAINPYMNFAPLPGQLVLDPATDFWVERDTVWTSTETRVVQTAQQAGRINETELVDLRSEQLDFLRQIDVDFTIRGFGGGEVLAELLFDGLDVTPSPALTADPSGTITGTFTIPANVTAGTKEVSATGAGDSKASGAFTGQGVLEVQTLRRINVTVAPQERDRSPFDTGGFDPLAQTFALTEPRHVSGVDVKFTAIGDTAKPVIVELHSVENGLPTQTVLAQAIVDMSTVTAGVWTEVRFDVPPYLPSDRQFAVMFKTNDDTHALATARIGDFDADAQRWVSAQPYAVGVLLSSSNAETWTAHQNEDLAFRIVAAKFSPLTKTVVLGSVSVTNMSDVLMRAGIETPEGGTGIYFEVERAGGEIVRLLPSQPWQLSEFATETVIIRAVLQGTEKASPTLWPNVLFVAGTLSTTGTYVTRAFDLGSAIRMSAFIKTFLPAGSSATIEIDSADDNWTGVSQHAATVLGDGWIEREYRVTPYTADNGRLRITLAGTPAARPRLTDMRAVAI